MIAAPKLSQLPFDVLLMGGTGYVLGRLTQVDAKLSALVLTVSSISNYVLFTVANRWLKPLLNHSFALPYISTQAVYTGTSALVSAITIFTAYQFKLISLSFAGVALLVSGVNLLARLRILALS